MPTYKLVTLKDPVTGEYLIPRTPLSLGYEVQPDGDLTPPIEMDAATLGGRPASDYMLKSEYTPVDLSEYIKTSDADTKYAVKLHIHTTAQVTGLDGALAGKAAVSHTHNVEQISGILPVTKGGTGVTDIDTLKSLLGITQTSNIYIEGGTASVIGGRTSRIETRGVPQCIFAMYTGASPGPMGFGYRGLNYLITSSIPGVGITWNDSSITIREDTGNNVGFNYIIFST